MTISFRMLGVAAARRLKRDFTGPSIHRRGMSCRGMFIDSHCKLTDAVIAQGNMSPHYLQSLGSELSYIDKEVFDEFLSKAHGEVDNFQGDRPRYGSCPMLLTATSCPPVFKQIRETALYSLLRNFMCKCGVIFSMGFFI